ncbi:uncharacterized protein LOC110721361 [Chenopodium quinoa]|uniref:uncharacterized protein LOC110721361 n=1 Tax=Chenopodium quinoa TaxID=63459 RepID=UPI000B77BA23|nr:uncharacterized protein LOC110721361 [Chenopodium quinoa]
MNAVTLRSGKQLEDPPVREPLKEVVEGVGANGKAVDSTMIEEEPKETTPPLAPYVPRVPFPQRLAQAKLEKKYGKFLDILKKLHINIPFLDAVSEIPSYAKFLKDMLSNRKKLEENATVALTVECSAILQNTLPKKLGDPGSYSIPVKLGDIEINRALCDLGAKMEEDAHVPIILGRPFLAIAGEIIDMKNGKITFEVGDEKMEYSLLNAMGTPSMGETIC